jgi:hypothetical protein
MSNDGWFAWMQGQLQDLQRRRRDGAWLRKQKNKRKGEEAKLARIYATPFPEIVKKAPNTVFDAENLWMRILHDSRIPAEEIKVIQLDDGERQQTYRGLNIYRRFEVAADEDHRDDTIELHRARNRFSTSIHIIRQKESMTAELLNSWLARMEVHLDEEYRWRPQENMMCILSCGTRAWFRHFFRTNPDEEGTWFVDTVLDRRGEAAKEGGKVVEGNGVDVSTAFGLWYAEDFLERGFEDAGQVVTPSSE